MFPHGETITIERPGAADRYGDPTQPGTEHTIEGCAFYPRYSDELHDVGRNTVITGLVILAPPGADIKASDTVRRADGTRWPVDGVAGDWINPFTGWRAGTQIALRQVTG